MVSGLAVYWKNLPAGGKIVLCQIPEGPSSQTLHPASSRITLVTWAAARVAHVALWIVAGGGGGSFIMTRRTSKGTWM